MPLPRRLALALVLALGPVLGGCSQSTELRRVRTPREGVALAYVHTTGQSFEGKLRVGNTRAIAGLREPLSQTVTCDVILAVLGEGPTGTEVRATFTSVELDWDLPPAATYSTDELVELAQQQLRGMQVSFVVRPDGRVQVLPAPPPEAAPELQEVIETMLMGLEAFFVPLPREPIAPRETWTERFGHATAEGLRLELEHQVELDGSFERRGDGTVLRRLAIEQHRREQRPTAEGPVTVEREARATVLFADAGYPAEIDREIREADPERGMVFRKVRAEWKPTRGAIPELVAPVGGDVQVIRDPCNPDYVGPLSCDEPQGTAEPDDARTPAETPKTEADVEAGDAAAPPDDAPADDDTD